MKKNWFEKRNRRRRQFIYLNSEVKQSKQEIAFLHRERREHQIEIKLILEHLGVEIATHTTEKYLKKKDKCCD